jgi:hypothetical protein
VLCRRVSVALTTVSRRVACRRCDPIAEAQARHFVCQLVNALDYLHFQKVRRTPVS